MSYNEKCLQIAEQTAKFAEVGFIVQVREIAQALSVCTINDIKTIAKQLMLSVETMESINQDIQYYKEKCDKEKEE